MKNKYITTKENPILKEGLNIDNTESTQIGIHYFETDRSLHINDDVLKDWLNNGYVKEVEEKEFTKSDMVEAIGQAHILGPWSAKEIFNDWLKQRDK